MRDTTLAARTRYNAVVAGGIDARKRYERRHVAE
jgi:hypothetical protein